VTPARGGGGGRGGTRRGSGGTGRGSGARAADRPPQHDQSRDVLAVVVVVVAVLAGFALWGQDLAGLLGTWLERALRGLFGVVGLAAPFALGAVAVALFRGRRPEHGRVAVGCALLVLGSAGLWHLRRGSPGLETGAPTLQEAGGYVGAVAALPLRTLAGAPGAVVVLLAVVAVGLMVATATRPRVLAARISGAWHDAVATRDEARERRRVTAEDRAAAEAEERELAEEDAARAVGGASEDRDGAGGASDDPDAARAPRRRRRGPRPGADATRVLDAPEAAGPREAEETVIVYDGVDGRVEADEGYRDADAAATVALAGPPGAAPVSAPAADDPTVVLGGKAGPGSTGRDGDVDGPGGTGDGGGETGDGTATALAPPTDDWADYELPSMALLRAGRVAPGNRKTLDQMTRALEHTLSQFGVDARVTRVSRGPTVTRFELSLGPGVKVAAVTKLGDDISYALATAEIRIVAPIPGKSAIGVEVPNRDRDHITLGDVLRSPEAAAARHPLTAGIGVDIAGNAVLVNLATMPHLLIAGATGSGKSVTMNGIVTSILMRATPAQVRMILVDPKRVELSSYEGAPHLLTPVVTDPKRATEALAWTVKEMEDRYERLALLGYRNIDTYNAAVRDGSVRQAPALSGKADETWRELPYILVVIDELADLMMVAPRDVEGAIVRIAQMARAVGIHLIIATQRPSVDVVTGLIKANVPSRIALAMASLTDSRTILDQQGAEKLVGHGDMLFLPANASKPHRIQGCYLDETEVEAAVEHCKAQRHADFAAGIVREGPAAQAADLSDDASDADLTQAARDLVVRSGLGSTSMLQRKLKVGFARAGRIMDELEEQGVVGPSEGSKARTVLMSVEELENRLERGE